MQGTNDIGKTKDYAGIDPSGFYLLQKILPATSIGVFFLPLAALGGHGRLHIVYGVFPSEFFVTILYSL